MKQAKEEADTKINKLEERVRAMEKDSETATGESTKVVMEELKKKNQLILVKDSEIDSLKKMLRELKATIEQNDQSA